MNREASETTLLLRNWAEGDPLALQQLTPRVYKELQKLAGGLMRHERPGRTLQATALVHEAYVRLIEVNNVQWEHRAHFYAIAAQVMRRVLLEGARKRATAKRGGGWGRVDITALPDPLTQRSEDLIALDDALEAFAKADPRKAKVVELRYFGGLSVEETAKVLNVSADTVMRDWRIARAWLLAEMKDSR